MEKEPNEKKEQNEQHLPAGSEEHAGTQGAEPAPQNGPTQQGTQNADPAPQGNERQENAPQGVRPPAPPRRGMAALLLRAPHEVSGFVFSLVVIAMLAVSLIFSVAVVTVIRSTGASQEDLQTTDTYIYLSYLLYQIVFFGVTALYLRVRRERPRAIGYRKTHWKYYPIAVALIFGTLFSLGWLNDWIVSLFSAIGYEPPQSTIPSLSGGGIVGAFIVIAILPALLEESIFRGILLEGMKGFGTVAACLLGGFLFSVFHQSPAQTVYQFICGVVFTLLALRADSILPSVAGHFVNNALILLDARFGWLARVQGGGAVALYVSSALCLVGAVVYLVFFDRKTNTKKSVSVKPFFLAAAPGIALCALLWLAAFIA